MSRAAPLPGFAYTSPHAAIEALASRLGAVGQEQIDLAESAGRVLSQPIYTDRDSPPSDVSAMDGYAVRSGDAEPLATIEVLGEIAIGQPAPAMPRRGCFKIGTGACVPEACDGVIPRELVIESEKSITLNDGLQFSPGQHIRRRGENTRRDSLIANPGTLITPPVASALAAFGHTSISVYRRILVALLTTGDELQPVSSKPEPWQIRDSNSATLCNALAYTPWIDIALVDHVADDQGVLVDALQAATNNADLVVTTGGVSMGDRDYLKPALLQAGGEVIYHKLPIRPGKPSLGGVLPNGQNNDFPVPVIALPGNPVAVAVGIPLFIAPLARQLAGISPPFSRRPRVQLIKPPSKTLRLWRYLPVRWVEDGCIELITTMGSGDLAGAALAEGYAEIPPEAAGTGPWVFYDAKL
ncbi:MAG: molybdopterin molybdotransferase MoeA [Planctomycetota bacterium]